MTSDELERYEERAAIMEHDGLMPRRDAERLALESIIASREASMSAREQAVALAKGLRQ